MLAAVCAGEGRLTLEERQRPSIVCDLLRSGRATKVIVEP